MLNFFLLYFFIGSLHQVIEYIFYWSYNSWSYERQSIRDINEINGCIFKGHELEMLLERHIFEIRKMLFWSTFMWPLTAGRYFIKTGSYHDIVTRSRLLKALFQSL